MTEVRSNNIPQDGLCVADQYLPNVIVQYSMCFPYRRLSCLDIVRLREDWRLDGVRRFSCRKFASRLADGTGEMEVLKGSRNRAVVSRI